MSYGDDLVLGQQPEEEQRGGLFGIQFTPKIIGILIALAGIAASVGLFMYVLQPLLTQQEELKTKITAKENENQAIEASLAKIDEARAKLETAKQGKAEVQVLLGNNRSIDTLLIDLNNFIKRAGGEMISIKPIYGDVLSTNLFPTATVDPKAPPGTKPPQGLYELQSFNIEMTATFTKTQSIIRNLERLQPMIVLGRYTSNVEPETLELVVNEQGKVLELTEPDLKSNFDMLVIVPAATEESVKPTTTTTTTSTTKTTTTTTPAKKP